MAKKIETINNGAGISSNGYNKIETWNAENIKGTVIYLLQGT